MKNIIILFLVFTAKFIGDIGLDSFLNVNSLKLWIGWMNTISFEKIVIEQKVKSPRLPCLNPKIEFIITYSTKHNCSIPGFYSIDGMQPCSNQSDHFKWTEQ